MPGDASEDSEEAAGLVRGRWREDAIDWQRTFSVGNVDFELLRSDWNDLRCNVSGNLQLPEAEAVDVVAQYMERLNMRHSGYGSEVPGGAGRGLDGTLSSSPRPHQALLWEWYTHARTPVRKCFLSLLVPPSCTSKPPTCHLGPEDESEPPRSLLEIDTHNPAKNPRIPPPTSTMLTGVLVLRGELRVPAPLTPLIGSPRPQELNPVSSSSRCGAGEWEPQFALRGS